MPNRFNRIVTLKVATPATKVYPYYYQKNTSTAAVAPGELAFLGATLGVIDVIDSTFAGGIHAVYLELTRQDEWLNNLRIPPHQAEAAAFRADDTLDRMGDVATYGASRLRFILFNRIQEPGITFTAQARTTGAGSIDIQPSADRLALVLTDPVLTGAHFDIGEDLFVGFNNRTFTGANVQDQTAWAKISEQESVIATIGVDLPVSTINTPTEVNQSAIITIRHNPNHTATRAVVDDLGREWTVNGRRLSDDRRFLELDCSRRLSV